RTERISVLCSGTVTRDQDVAAVRIDNALEKIREAPGRNGVPRISQSKAAVLGDVVIGLLSSGITGGRTLGCLVQILPVSEGQAGKIACRVKLENLLRKFADAIGGNDIAREWLADKGAWLVRIGASRERIENCDQLAGSGVGLREVPGPLQIAGRSDYARLCAAFFVSFVVEKEKRFISSDRSA